MENQNDLIAITVPKIECSKHGVSDSWMTIKNAEGSEDHFCAVCISDLLKDRIGTCLVVNVGLDGSDNLMNSAEEKVNCDDCGREIWSSEAVAANGNPDGNKYWCKDCG